MQYAPTSFTFHDSRLTTHAQSSLLDSYQNSPPTPLFLQRGFSFFTQQVIQERGVSLCIILDHTPLSLLSQILLINLPQKERGRG